MSLFFSNIVREIGFERENVKKNKHDKHHYNMELKMNSSNQTLLLNSFGNFDLSICIPGYDRSTFIPLKGDDDEDLLIVEQNEQTAYI